MREQPSRGPSVITSSNQTLNWYLLEVPIRLEYKSRVRMRRQRHVLDRRSLEAKKPRPACDRSRVNGVVHQIRDTHHRLEPVKVLNKVLMGHHSFVQDSPQHPRFTQQRQEFSTTNHQLSKRMIETGRIVTQAAPRGARKTRSETEPSDTFIDQHRN